jgi:predicted O-methyltransferase YrrM
MAPGRSTDANPGRSPKCRTLDSPPRVCDRGGVARVGHLVEQMRRAVREPRRLRRLHYSSVLAAAHGVVEPDDAGVLAQLLGVERAAHHGLVADLVGDAAFADAIDRRHRAVRGTPLRLFAGASARDADARLRLLYGCVRVLRPRAVVETGVFDGVSTSVILKALADDGGGGRLVSIDLPARAPVPGSTDKMAVTTLPPGQPSGWLVPDALRERWTLREGSARELLPSVLSALGVVDAFFHDSLHTAAHMTWEWDVVWPALAPGGLLLSDDVFWSTAFWRFCRRRRVRGLVARGMGLICKPPF